MAGVSKEVVSECFRLVSCGREEVGNPNAKDKKSNWEGRELV